MDAMQNGSANAGRTTDESVSVDDGVKAGTTADEAASAAVPDDAGGAADTTEPVESAESAEAAEASKGTDTPAATGDAGSAETETEAGEMPQPRAADGESSSGKGKKRKTAPKAKAVAATKSLVVFRDGKVHYADESVVVLDLDDAAHPDTDVHDVVDKLSELRDAIESSGRTEAVALVAELIQVKALA